MLWLWETVFVVVHLCTGYFPFALQTFHLFPICSVPEEADHCVKGSLFLWLPVEFGQWGSLARDWREGGNWGRGIYFLSTFPARSPRLAVSLSLRQQSCQTALSDSSSYTPGPSKQCLLTYRWHYFPLLLASSSHSILSHPCSQLLSQVPCGSVPSTGPIQSCLFVTSKVVKAEQTLTAQTLKSEAPGIGSQLQNWDLERAC